MQTQAEVQARYQAALERLAARLEEDYYVLAMVLYGSMARGEAWERSDVDIVIILRDGQERAVRSLWIVEDDVHFSASVMTRAEYRRALEGSLQGAMTHSIRSQSRLVFSKDESITTWLNESSRVGERDQVYSLLNASAGLPWMLDKARKWYTVKHDMNYCFLWLLFAVNSLAQIEVLLNGEAPHREALDQALKFNPDFFQANYIDLVNGPKDEATLGRVLEAVEGYMVDRAERLFHPILDYLAHAGGPVPVSDLNNHFRKKTQGAYLDGVYEWLARQGILQQLSAPLQLTRKSQVSLEEPAFYYDTDDISDWERSV